MYRCYCYTLTSAAAGALWRSAFDFNPAQLQNPCLPGAHGLQQARPQIGGGRRTGNAPKLLFVALLLARRRSGRPSQRCLACRRNASRFAARLVQIDKSIPHTSLRRRMSAAYALGARALINALWAWPMHRPLNP